MAQITDTATYIVQSILPSEANVVVTEREDNGTIIITVNAVSDFIGQLIGKEGKVIKSIRTLLNLAYPDVRYLLEIKE